MASVCAASRVHGCTSWRPPLACLLRPQRSRPPRRVVLYNSNGDGVSKLRPVRRPRRSASRVKALQSVVQWPIPVVNAVNIYACALYALLLSTSVLKWSRITVRRLRTELLLLPVCLAYLFLLVLSWKPDTVQILFPGSLQAGLENGFNPQFFPNVPGISHLFSRCSITASSMWLHLLAANLFSAVQICIDGMRRNIFTLHSIVLSIFSGVFGLLSHYLTTIFQRRSRKSVTRGGDGFTVYKFNSDKKEP